MHLWLVSPYGALPGESWREYRAVLAARALVAAGHTVTWWTASFEHRSKTFRGHDWEVQTPFPGFDIIIVPTTGYTKHISLARIRFERTFARRLAETPERAPRPSVIVLGEPALFTAGPVMALARRWNVPVVLDIGDLWPELFEIALPRLLRPLGSTIFSPLYRRRAALARQSHGYTAASRDYLALFQSLAPRAATAVVYSGVDVAGVRAEMMAQTALPPAVTERTKQAGDLWVVYAGTLGPNYDIKTILGAAELLLPERPSITIFIAGAGESRVQVDEGIATRGLSNCIFLGSLSAAAVAKLYGRCDAALSSYVAGSTVSMPIKAYDYFAAGLPVVNSLGNDLEHFVTTRHVGLQYIAENPRALADSLLRLASDDALRERLAENAARLGMEFDWRVQYRGMVDVAERVALEARRQGAVATS